MKNKPQLNDINLGVIGFGSFAMFALQQFLQIEGVTLKGMSGTRREAAFRAAERYGVKEIKEIDEMLKSKEIKLVYISTPPFLHYSHAMSALKAGKHVIVEKPMALTLKQANEMIAEAKRKNLLITANLMQRYNPLYDKMQELIDSGTLGELLHAYFENYASDEALPMDHWFWDREKSGGIFIEHGVHFFDMFEGWLGKGIVESAQISRRSDSKIEDQAQCTIRYKNNILVNFYHGFTQTKRMDRQEMRFIFEKGDITLYGWIPNQVKIHAISDESEMKIISGIFSPNPRINVLYRYDGKERLATSRGKNFEIYQQYELIYKENDYKMKLYGQLLRSLIEDQIAWIKNKNHQRKITEINGKNSLSMAIEADRLAHRNPIK